jgi:ATP-binding cassette subfamily F protein uup
MSLVTIENLTIGFQGPPLLDEVSCRIEMNQRIGLLGRNGAGKTTLMRILNGDVEPDGGNVVIKSDTHIALLQQDVPQDTKGTINEIVGTGLPKLPASAEEQLRWQQENEVAQIVSRMQLDGESRFETLSSGMKRRVLLARAIVSKPGLLLLDEPTNHLDIEAINWLEEFLLKWPASLMFVTHDRMFLRRMVTRILEIDRGRIFDWTCDYDTFLVRKEQALAAEEKQNALFDKRLAEEEAWIRRGIKARRTRNEGRVRALKKMREERSGRRDHVKTSNLQIQEGGRSGTLVIEAKDISYAYESDNVVEGFSTEITRGDKVGIIGPNGVGKTTLLKLLLGELKPDRGSVRLGTNLEIAYFDQLREQLDPDETVQQNVGDGYDHINIGDQKKHIIGYLQEFLFAPERARTQVKFLSGGERNRVLLAKLFTKSANVIVLDEPTNDLDTETLEMLEEKLVEFGGTVLVVSHDRAFLNNVVTSSLVFEDSGLKEYVGGYDDWIRQRAPAVVADKAAAKKEKKRKSESEADQPRKLKYKEKLELEKLPGKIEAHEASIAEFHEAMADPDFYQKPKDHIAARQKELSELETALANFYQRWEELEMLSEG